MDGKRITKSLHDEAIKLQVELRTRMALAITTAFALVIALYWQDVIRQGVDDLLKLLGISIVSAYLYKVLSAIVVTIICVVGVWYFGKWSQQPVEQPKQQKLKIQKI